MSLTLVFIDTEFSDFINTEILSLGAISSRDGSKFYYERNDFDLKICSDFVRYEILPMFGKTSCIGNKQQMADALRQWLNNLDGEKIVVVFDYYADWELFCDLLEDDLGSKIQGGALLQDVCKEAMPNVLVNAVEDYFDVNPSGRHHALHDAEANFHGWRACMKSIGLF